LGVVAAIPIVSNTWRFWPIRVSFLSTSCLILQKGSEDFVVVVDFKGVFWQNFFILVTQLHTLI